MSKISTFPNYVFSCDVEKAIENEFPVEKVGDEERH